MPEKSGFFDSTSTDVRTYPARDFADYFAQILTNGVFNGGQYLNPTATGTDAIVRISPGYAWINGYVYSIYATPLSLQIQPATSLPRIDRIVLRLDTSLPTRSIRALVIQGSPNSNPTPPSLIRSGDVYELSLAQVRVDANSTIITQANITDERLNNAVCGLVNSLVQVDTATFQKQWNDFIASVQQNGFLPTTGGSLTGPLRISSWGEISASSGGYVLYGHNCYLDASGVVYRYRNTHATMGARGIVFRLGAGLQGAWMFDMGAIATTAGTSFTPALKRILNTDDYDSLNTQMEQSDLWGAL